MAARPAKAMTYDANGNLINDGERTYRWDAENRLVKIIGAYGRTEFEYDGLSRRVKLTERDQTGLNTLAERRFGWEGTAIAEERDASDDVVKRFWGLGETRHVTINNQPSTLKLTYTRDHLGSIREVLDETCAIRARYAYDEWGERTKVGGILECDFGFTGHFEHAASGITLAPYRGYRSAIGRWISRDLIAEYGGLNLYGYVANDPVGYFDPLGLAPVAGGTADNGVNFADLMDMSSQEAAKADAEAQAMIKALSDAMVDIADASKGGFDPFDAACKAITGFKPTTDIGKQIQSKAKDALKGIGKQKLKDWLDPTKTGKEKPRKTKPVPITPNPTPRSPFKAAPVQPSGPLKTGNT